MIIIILGVELTIFMGSYCFALMTRVLQSVLFYLRKLISEIVLYYLYHA